MKGAATLPTVGFLVGLLLPAEAQLLLRLEGVPRSGWAVARVDMTAAVQWAKGGPVEPGGLRAFAADGRPLPCQFIPDPDFDGRGRIAGTMILRLPAGGRQRVVLRFLPSPPPKPSPWAGIVRIASCAIAHDPRRMGGLPWRFEFPKKVFDTFVWNDRVHHRELGSFHLRHDPSPQVHLLSEGEMATVVRVRARYCRADGQQPPSQPEAIYDWVYFRDLPLVLVMAKVQQREPSAWNEVHFLELNFPDESFRRWAGGEPLRQGEFQANQQSFRFPTWGALLDGPHAIAVLSGDVLFHDGRGGYGTYLHAGGSLAWQEWRERERRFAAWLWVGAQEEPIPALREAVEGLPTSAHALVTTPALERALEALRASKEPEAGWKAAVAERLLAQGRFEEAWRWAQGQRASTRWGLLKLGEMRIAWESDGHGLRLQSLYDAAVGRELLAASAPPLFTLTLRHRGTKEEVTLSAEEGWTRVSLVPSSQGGEARWRLERPQPPLSLEVVLRWEPSPEGSGILWHPAVHCRGEGWEVRRFLFPQVAVADLGEGGCVFFPRGPGEVQQGIWRRSFLYQGTYPNGWTTMQFMAAYLPLSQGPATGLYFGFHDPLASTKEIRLESRPQERAVLLAFEHPFPHSDLTGFAVWRILRGDWFDAALLYRDWVRREARWFPPLGPEGRRDTPAWMKELCVWALGGGAPKECVPAVKEFAAFMGLPVGFHWYNWHQIPFDNDYPHYFPTKEGFLEGVRELQQAGVRVMPYINGRLWDTRDGGLEDFEFSSLARPAATKDENGEPYIEVYGSREQDGSPVRLAVMCPATNLWQSKVRGIVLRLFHEFGLDAVYIDQVAAAAPRLCFDAAHGHPLGGGHWWVEGYGAMLETLRRAMPGNRMLTTECNAEPFLKWFDGYLTWHWQHNGQVPAFPAVYGGAIQMFGRAYRGGATKDLALRMKAGQQLVFGEQIGWIDPHIVREKENAEFLREAVWVRHHLRRYFYAGEMARPPRLLGEVPKVRADWQWSGEWWVETDAVLAGAWRLPREGKLALFLVNVSDEPLTTSLALDGRTYGLAGKHLRAVRVTERGWGEPETWPIVSRRTWSLPARSVLAWEVSAVR